MYSLYTYTQCAYRKFKAWNRLQAGINASMKRKRSGEQNTNDESKECGINQKCSTMIFSSIQFFFPFFHCKTPKSITTYLALLYLENCSPYICLYMERGLWKCSSSLNSLYEQTSLDFNENRSKWIKKILQNWNVLKCRIQGYKVAKVETL